MIEYNTDIDLHTYYEEEDIFIEGKLTHLSDYIIKVKLESPYVYWVAQRAMNPFGIKRGNSFIHNYHKISAQLLKMAYHKIKYIDENIDHLEYDYLLLQENLIELDLLPNKNTARRIKRILEDDFFRRGILNTNLYGFVLNAHDRTLISEIIKAYCEDKTKIYLPS